MSKVREPAGRSRETSASPVVESGKVKVRLLTLIVGDWAMIAVRRLVLAYHYRKICFLAMADDERAGGLDERCR
jgi:hypothetical protein